jgi:hypothetical protein
MELDRLILPVNLRKGLGHETGMQTHMGIAHLAFNFRTRGQGCDRIHHHDIHGPGTHEHICDFEGLFARIRLGNEQISHIDSQLLGIDRIQGMLGIDKCSTPLFSAFRQ